MKSLIASLQKFLALLFVDLFKRFFPFGYSTDTYMAPLEEVEET